MLLLLAPINLCIPLACMPLSASVRLAALLAFSLLVTDADALTSLLVVSTQWNRPALLIAAKALPFCPACFLQQLIAYIAGGNLGSKSVGAWLCTSVPCCHWRCVGLSNVLSQSCHDPTFSELPALTKLGINTKLVSNWMLDWTCSSLSQRTQVACAELGRVEEVTWRSALQTLIEILAA